MDALALPLCTILGNGRRHLRQPRSRARVMRRVTPGPRLTAIMRAMPGAILASIIAPSALAAGPAEAAATAVTALAAWRFGNLPLAMCVGVAAVLVLRPFMP